MPARSAEASEMQGIEFVVAAYVLTWVVLAGYVTYVWRRFSRAEKALRAEEETAVVTDRRTVGGAA